MNKSENKVSRYEFKREYCNLTNKLAILNLNWSESIGNEICELFSMFTDSLIKVTIYKSKDQSSEDKKKHFFGIAEFTNKEGAYKILESCDGAEFSGDGYFIFQVVKEEQIITNEIIVEVKNEYKQIIS